MKKKVLVSAGALALAVGVTAAGTLAYLQDNTDAVTNNFTYNAASQNVSLTLFEHKLNADGLTVGSEEIAEGASQDYKIIPGATAVKDPTLRVTSGDTKVYVYAEVVETDSGEVLTPNMADGWTELEDVAGANGGTVYVLTASQSGGVNTGMQDGAAKTADYKVLESVTYASSMDEDKTGSIVVYGYVVDAVAGADAGDVYTATFNA